MPRACSCLTQILGSARVPGTWISTLIFVSLLGCVIGCFHHQKEFRKIRLNYAPSDTTQSCLCGLLIGSERNCEPNWFGVTLMTIRPGQQEKLAMNPQENRQVVKDLYGDMTNRKSSILLRYLLPGSRSFRWNQLLRNPSQPSTAISYGRKLPKSSLKLPKPRPQ